MDAPTTFVHQNDSATWSDRTGASPCGSIFFSHRIWYNDDMVRQSACIPVEPSSTLREVKREFHTRRKGCYITVDRYGPVLVAQKLSRLVEYINAAAPDAASRVSVPTLHQICDNESNRVCGWSKHRYRVRFVPLDRVREAFEMERAKGVSSFILGEPECYTLAPVAA